jgi:short-subunit dehydrogenase
LQEHSNIDVLICNAGHGDFRTLENFSGKQIADFINLNLISHIILCRHIVSSMKTIGSGDIIVLGSEAALVGKKKASLYSAAKFGLRGFTQSLRDECGNTGVRVCLINPGLVRSPFFDSLDFKPGEAKNNAIEPGDIAKIVLEVIKTRKGTIVDEINLSPASKSIIFN